MGCNSNPAIKESCEDKETEDAFIKLEKTINEYRKAIAEYKNYLEEYENILKKEISCEKLINYYFRIQKRVNLANEPQEIRYYKKTFYKVNRLEERLNIKPGCIKEIL